MLESDRIARILERLRAAYGDVSESRELGDPFEVLIFTILAAQSTDKQVAKVMEKLLADHPTPQSIAKLTAGELEPYVKSCGVYKNKARNIVLTCQILVEKYGGRVPDTLEELVQLPGVGRKTANIVLAYAFGRSAMAVDTHVFRVSNRIGLADAKDVVKTEQDLMRNIPEADWSSAHLWLITHGRRVCKARKPLCAVCPVAEDCAARLKGLF